uniref:TetR/AcrR family transcriptional regulator n=1 Tax=Caldimicrobium thiodismutans TaxID=1653476 RepID=A0A832LW46_9BACT
MRKNTKEAIIAAGLKLFSEKGYLGATTREIAKLAGVSEVTLFRHFTNKQNLFISVLQQYSFLPQLRELTKELQKRPLKEALKVIAINFLNELRAKRDLINIIHAEHKRYPEVLKEYFRNLSDSLITELAEFLRGYEREGILRDGDIFLMAQAFFWPLFFLFSL